MWRRSAVLSTFLPLLGLMLMADAVYAAVQRAMRELGAPAGRSAYGEAAEVEQAIGIVRKDIAALVGSTEGAARVHYHNALRAVKELLDE